MPKYTIERGSRAFLILRLDFEECLEELGYLKKLAQGSRERWILTDKGCTRGRYSRNPFSREILFDAEIHLEAAQLYHQKEKKEYCRGCELFKKYGQEAAF